MARFYILTYAVFFLKILCCLTRHTNSELRNSLSSEECDKDISNVLVRPWYNSDYDDFYDDIFNTELYDDEDDFYDDIFNIELYDDEDDNSPILSRVRRRIFPGVGKALDRDRGDRKTWVRTREGQDEQTDNQVLRRDGPMGTELLYELYPDLAPPNWKDRRVSYSGKPLNEEILQEQPTSILEEEPTFKIERDVGRRNVEKRSKQKVRISKKQKEEIAVFAEEHGSSAAVAYFSNKVNFPLKKNAVEKYVRRYRRRRERQRKRRISRRS